MPNGPRPERRILHGRRRGHRLRPARRTLLRDLLPAIAVPGTEPGSDGLIPARLFRFPVRETWLEIGFGGGEHLAAQAAANPDVGLVGCEPYVNGIAKLLAIVAERGLRNVRIHGDDARDLVDRLPDGSVARVFILFPDPWPKARHHRRRIVSAETLGGLARIMADGAELRLATDHAEYGRWMLDHLEHDRRFEWLSRRPGDWRNRTGDWPPTRYEAKAVAQGRSCLYLRYRRRPRLEEPRPEKP